MKNTTQDLINRFEAFHSDLLNFVEQADEDQWQILTEAEGWKVGVTAHHIGAIHYPVIDQVQLMIESAPLTTTTMADIDRLNEAHVREYADVTPAQTIEFLQQEGGRVQRWLAALTQDGLEVTAYIDFMGGDVSAERLLEVVLFDLAEGHFDSIRQTVASQREVAAADGELI